MVQSFTEPKDEAVKVPPECVRKRSICAQAQQTIGLSEALGERSGTCALCQAPGLRCLSLSRSTHPHQKGQSCDCP